MEVSLVNWIFNQSNTPKSALEPSELTLQDIYGEIMSRMRPCQEYSELVEFMKPIELGYSNIQSLVYIGLWLITVNCSISLVQCRIPAKTTEGL